MKNLHVKLFENWEMDPEEYSSGYSYEYAEGPGASEKELDDIIKKYKVDPDLWERVKVDFMLLANGEAADIKTDYYPDWKKEDFERVLSELS